MLALSARRLIQSDRSRNMRIDFLNKYILCSCTLNYYLLVHKMSSVGHTTEEGRGDGKQRECLGHKVRTYKEYHSVCPSSELGLSQPLSRQRVFPSPHPETGGRGHTSLRVGGWGGVPIPTRGIHYGTLYMYVLCGLGPLSWSVHHSLTRDGYIESTYCCVQARFLGLETKILFSLLLYIQRYLIMYLRFELVLNKYVTKIQLPGNDIWLLTIPQRYKTEF